MSVVAIYFSVRSLTPATRISEPAPSHFSSCYFFIFIFYLCFILFSFLSELVAWVDKMDPCPYQYHAKIRKGNECAEIFIPTLFDFNKVSMSTTRWLKFIYIHKLHNKGVYNMYKCDSFYQNETLLCKTPN